MSCHGHISPITGPLWGESTGHQWISLTNGPVLWSFSLLLIVSWKSHWTVKLPIIWEAMTLMWYHSHTFDVMMGFITRGSSYKLHVCVYFVASLCLLMTCSCYHRHRNNWYKSYQWISMFNNIGSNNVFLPVCASPDLLLTCSQFNPPRAYFSKFWIKIYRIACLQNISCFIQALW